MTMQKRVLIAAEDVVGIECECTHCHARYSIAIERVDRFIRECPNCHERWFDETEGRYRSPKVAETSEGSEDAVFVRFVEALRLFRTLKPGATVRLEIAEAELSTS